MVMLLPVLMLGGHSKECNWRKLIFVFVSLLVIGMTFVQKATLELHSRHQCSLLGSSHAVNKIIKDFFLSRPVLAFFRLTHIPFVMVNLMCQLNRAIGCSDIGQTFF